MAKKLTVAAVENIKATDRRREIPDAALPGFYLVVQTSGARSWAVRYRHGGKPRKLTLGRYPALGLAAAREKAREALRAVSEGTDPAVKDQPDRDLFGTVCADFLRRHVDQMKSGAETRRILERYVLPIWGERRIDQITRRDVIELLDGIADRGAPIMANRTLAAVRKLFNWSLSRAVIDSSPCAGVKAPAAERTRDRILSDDEIRWFWRATERMAYPFGTLFRFLLLTGQRREEAAGMTVEEISGDEWRIPRSRTKKDRAHFVPLSAPALEVIEGQPPFGRFIFTTNGRAPVAGFGKALDRLRAMVAEEAAQEGHDAEVPPFTIHDLRRTCASGMARCGAPLEVIEKAQNRVSGKLSGVAAIYNRHHYGDEIRQALEAWAALLMEITEGQPGGNVVSLRAGA